MINSLKILNFQSHAKTKLNFHEGVNVIVGTTDGGKTAIIRALRWLIWNRPSGDALRSRWGGTTNVRLATEEGVVVRSKDKIDTYQLCLLGEEKIEFKAIGVSVPTEIQRFLNIEEINLQGQLDPPFLLSDTSGGVAQHFNKIARLNKIDTGTQNVNSAIREITSNIKHKQEDVKTVKEQLTSYDYLEKFEVEVEALESMEKELQRKQNQQKKGKLLVSKIAFAEEDLKRIEKIHALDKTVNNILQLYKDKRSLEDRKMLLFKAVSTLNSTITTLNNYEARHTRLLAQFKKEMPDICPLCGRGSKIIIKGSEMAAIIRRERK